jgi:hypothetical protein
MQIGVYTWSGAIWNTATSCFISLQDCLFTAFNAVMGVWEVAWNAANVGRRSASGIPVYAISNPINSYGHYFESHISFGNALSLGDALKLQNGSATEVWTHIITMYDGSGTESHYVFHRREQSNYTISGTLNHVRSQPASSGLKARQDGDTSEGVTVDYWWADGQNNLWSDVNSEDGSGIVDSLGSGMANWMEDNNAQASCCSLMVNNDVSYFYENQGVASWSTSSQPFNDGGDVDSWVSACSS